jgi:hypothetical protein
VARAGSLISCAVVVAILSQAIRRAETKAQRDHAYGLTITAMLLVSPITWDHYFLLLLQPIATLWVCLPRNLVIRGSFLVVLVCLWTWAYPLYQLLIPGGRENGIATPFHVLTILSFQFYALILLFILGTTAIFQRWGDTTWVDAQESRERSPSPSLS